jgi:hypothetical protein
MTDNISIARLKELTDIRNKLYDALPSGEISAWDLIQIIKWHLNDLDTFIDASSNKE